MPEVCVSCLKENVASKKIIINNNGKLKKSFSMMIVVNMD